MIITVQKPLLEIIEKIKAHSRIYIVGCAACATKCQTGSEEAVLKMAEELKQAGKEVAGHIVLDTPCDIRIVKKDLGRVAAADPSLVFLVLACGAGVQAIEKTLPNHRLYPALDPVFTGTTERIGIYHEYCSLCGECILDRTAGICPVTRCAKGLLNGPCGGSIGGKCEVDQERDCAWALIVDKLKRTGELDSFFKQVIAPRTVVKLKTLNTKKKHE